MFGKDGGVVDDTLVLGRLGDLQRDELGAEGKNIQLGPIGKV